MNIKYISNTHQKGVKILALAKGQKLLELHKIFSGVLSELIRTRYHRNIHPKQKAKPHFKRFNLIKNISLQN